MAEFPAMPLYTDALLADCGHLTDAEFGLYLRLLIQMWRSPTSDGCLPDDDTWLAKRFGRSVEVVQRDLRPLIDEFCSKRSGKKLTQRRLQRELAHAHEYRRKQSERAKSMWEKKKGISRGNAGAYAGGDATMAYASLAMHPNPISKKLTTSEQDAEKKDGQAGNKKKNMPVVSEYLASKYTTPKPSPSVAEPTYEELEIPDELRRA